MTKVWVCPACGERNALDASECASCGRWPSLFDLERTVDADDDGVDPDDELWAPAGDPVPGGPVEPSRADEVASAPVGPEAGTDEATEQPAQPGGHSLLRWLLPLVAAGWILARLIAEQF